MSNSTHKCILLSNSYSVSGMLFVKSFSYNFKESPLKTIIGESLLLSEKMVSVPVQYWWPESAKWNFPIEVAVEVIPRLCKSKFDNGELEELLFVDLPHEYRLNSGQTVLEYKKAVQESVYEQLRVVWEGQLKIVFTSELKVLSWDFCAKSHEELLPRWSIVPQVNQLVALASKYQSMAHSNGNGISVEELQPICKVFVACAHQLANSLEPPCVNELGFTKRFVRCIQIAEVALLKVLPNFLL
ncbi:hypothetical protein GOP47_0024329 [Adiantum capillus-veneris]|uniref:Uncharacterized protein n=1 Tax=Adiantum capillus-veneris TaxID=13818 RepID=A0A9D4U3V1_ADICA|nr:hypothetical protein GOP47_0024329 [Adiantum capillus-veneris]